MIDLATAREKKAKIEEIFNLGLRVPIDFVKILSIMRFGQ